MDPTNPLYNPRAPGYWGNNISGRIRCEQVIGKVTRWNIDKIMAMGLPFALWREASATNPSLPDCTCVKNTSKQPDIPCLSCYGTGKIPGYVKFGTVNYWMASTTAGWTLTNIVLDTTNRPYRLQLVPGAVTGTAISAPVTISTTAKIGPWEAKADGFTRDGGAGSTIVVEASKDSGVTWFALSALETEAPTTTVVFRVTMTRALATTKSPMFEIVRIRYQSMRDIRREVDEPVIRCLTTWDKTAEYRTQYGNRVDNSGKRFWTMPLTFFDPTLSRDTKVARLADDVFIEVRYGGSIGIRYGLIEFDYSDTFGQFTHQAFSLRQYAGAPGDIQGEHAYRVW